MPYRQNRHLPDRVKHVLPEPAQSIWRRAFNAAAEEHGEDDEGRLVRIAWGAVRNAGYRKGDEGMWEMMEKQDGWLIKTAKQRYTLGIVYEPDTLDTDEEYAGAEVIQRACWGFMAKLQGRTALTKQVNQVIDALIKVFTTHTAPHGVRVDITDLMDIVEKSRLGDQHSSWDDTYGAIVECYLAPCEMQIGKETIKAGTWLMGVIWSPEQFAKIEAGERRGYSMGGIGRSEYREALGHAA